MGVAAGRPVAIQRAVIVGHSGNLVLSGARTPGFAPFCRAANRTAAVIVGRARRISPQVTHDHHDAPALLATKDLDDGKRR